ncbi:MAG TPA: GNAT family N-acetyltransferase [Methanomassiliicoccales archaeon]|jgi:phosphinothricin acetyltransferase
MRLTFVIRMNVHIRDAKGSDIEAINDIYNYYVLNSTCTAQTEPEPREGREQWFSEHTGKYVVIVAEWEGQVVGWGSLSRYHRRHAYWPTAEDSIYVKHDMLHKGIGKMLLEALIKKARESGFHSLMGVISSEQLASIRLHECFGFQEVGHLREVELKFNRRLDVTFMQLML